VLHRRLPNTRPWHWRSPLQILEGLVGRDFRPCMQPKTEAIAYNHSMPLSRLRSRRRAPLSELICFSVELFTRGPINKKSYAELMPNLGQTLDIRKTWDISPINKKSYEKLMPNLWQTCAKVMQNLSHQLRWHKSNIGRLCWRLTSNKHCKQKQ